MEDYNYYKTPIAVAERLGLADMRNSAGEGFVILSKSDLRMLDMTVEEKVQFFALEVYDEGEALHLIEENKEEENEELMEETDGTVQEGADPSESEIMEGQEDE